MPLSKVMRAHTSKGRSSWAPFLKMLEARSNTDGLWKKEEKNKTKHWCLSMHSICPCMKWSRQGMHLMVTCWTYSTNLIVSVTVCIKKIVSLSQLQKMFTSVYCKYRNLLCKSYAFLYVQSVSWCRTFTHSGIVIMILVLLI